MREGEGESGKYKTPRPAITNWLLEIYIFGLLS